MDVFFEAKAPKCCSKRRRAPRRCDARSVGEGRSGSRDVRRSVGFGGCARARSSSISYSSSSRATGRKRTSAAVDGGGRLVRCGISLVRRGGETRDENRRAGVRKPAAARRTSVETHPGRRGGTGTGDVLPGRRHEPGPERVGGGVRSMVARTKVADCGQTGAEGLQRYESISHSGDFFLLQLHQTGGGLILKKRTLSVAHYFHLTDSRA